MSYSQSWTQDSGTTSTDCSTDQEKTESSSCSSKNKHHKNELNRDSYKVSSEQIIVHRWFLSDIQSLKNREESCYLQSSSFGCTGENGFLQWIIRFHPIAPSHNKHSFDSIEQKESLAQGGNTSALSKTSKDAQQTLLNTLRNMISSKDNQSNTESLNHLFNELLLKSISNIEQSTTAKEDIEKVISLQKPVHSPILNHHVLKTLPEHSMIASEGDSSLSDDKPYCAFEILRVNGYEPSSQTLFETNYQIFEVADDGILSLLKAEGRHQVHFNRALIALPHDTVFSISSNNILFSIKLIIYECSSTVVSLQPISHTNKSIKKLSSDEPRLSNISSGDDSNLYNSNSTGNIFWLMSTQKRFTDIIICSSDGQQFHAHRLILCTSCKKFAKLIAENQQINQIEIHSTNGIILKRILQYIYTGEIEICTGQFSIDEIRDLLNVADEFELFQLKNILTKKCVNHITQKNCFDLLEIADDKQMKILKNRILTFLCQKSSQIFESDIWQQFRNTRPHLYHENFSNLVRLNHLQTSIIEQLQEKKA